MTNLKWFHAIGICGKTTANVALMFKKQGWFVTGSDNQFFPPVSQQLEKEKIPTVEGYSYKHLTKEFWEEKLNLKLEINENPDLGLIIETASIKNKEYLFAQKKGIKITPYPLILKKYLVKEESIVVIGSTGKTTTTTLTVFLMQKLGLDPSYMIGAETLDIEESLKNTDSNFSVLEGDEFYNPTLSKGAKFLQYKPKYLIITKLDWEHQDIFPSYERYLEEFKKVVDLIPSDGLIIAKDEDENIDKIIKDAKCKVIRYGIKKKDQKENWRIEKELNEIYKIYNKDHFILKFKTSLLGDYNILNILASVVLILNLPARTLTMEILGKATENLSIISSAIEEFKGVKKRLQIIYKTEDIIIVDDFGVTALRAKNSLNTLKEEFPEFKLYIIFEPNSASRQREDFNEIYTNCFNNADKIIIPNLSESDHSLLTTNEIVEKLKTIYKEVYTISSENLSLELIKSINESKSRKEKLLIVFFSSYRLTRIGEELKLYLETL